MTNRQISGLYRKFPAILCGLLMLGLAAARYALAGDWRSPHLEYWSGNLYYVLRVNASNKGLALFHCSAMSASKAGTETVIWRVPSPLKSSDALPAAAYVRDDGKYVVLAHYDSRIGVGAVLTFLDARGQRLRSYTPNQLFSISELSEAPVTTAMTEWDANAFFRFTDTGDWFGFLTDNGIAGVFDLKNGSRLGDSDPGISAFRKLARGVERHDLSSTTETDLDQGITLARALRDRDSVPRLTRLLTDPYHIQAFTTGRHGRHYDFYIRQFQAGYSLVEILGAKAAPLIEDRLPNANAYMKVEWLSLLGDTGVAGQSAAVLNETQSEDPNVRTAAISAITEKSGADVVRKHPSWLEDPSSDIRMRSVSSLADSGDARDLPALLRALDDRDEAVRYSGQRGLIRLNVPDLDSILKRTIHAHPNEIDAHITLANRGDQEQLKWCANVLSHFADAWRHDHSRDYVKFDGLHVVPEDLQEVAKAIASHHPDGARMAFAKVASLPGNIYNGPAYFQAVGYGGLAGLGDTGALVRVRKLASDSDPSTAVNAIEWIGICRDSASVPLLRQLLVDREVLIRIAAHKALAAMGLSDVLKPQVLTAAPPATPVPATALPWWYAGAPLTLLVLFAILARILRRRPKR